MSDIIHLLPDSVANQIAAGEVIQRPASIIKELVENSLDANATWIQVVVLDAGKSLVQVIDNGKGMSPTDARLSFERHATSKILKATDLFALSTMGFRGEALASIAAVAQVELNTRTEKDDLGTCICIEGSHVVRQEPTSCPVGANFAVRNLFFNIPARRKFLKSNQTELANIMGEFQRIALAHPDVHFSLHSEGNLVTDLPAGNFHQRIVDIFGRRIDKDLIPIETDTTLVRLKGFVGVPTAAKKKNAHQYLFVNGRFMRHPYFAKAIQTAYERLIADGLQIPFFVNFTVDPARIDVNIHPTKTEIKFEDDSAIFQILLAAVREGLGKFRAVPSFEFDTTASPDFPAFNSDLAASGNEIHAPQVRLDPQYNPFKKDTMPSGGTASPGNAPSFERPAPIDWKKVFDAAQQLTDETVAATPAPQDFAQTTAPAPDAQTSSSLFPEKTIEEATDDTANLGDTFMQIDGSFIAYPHESGIALVHQHRAHVRILYERYMRQMAEHTTATTRTLFPEMITVTPAEDVVLTELLPKLNEIGFELSPLGAGSYSILALPLGTEGLNAPQLVGTLLADTIEGQADAKETVNHTLALALARRVAMPEGQILTQQEMKHLCISLLHCTTPALTPDGKPTLQFLEPRNLF